MCLWQTCLNAEICRPFLILTSGDIFHMRGGSREREWIKDGRLLRPNTGEYNSDVQASFKFIATPTANNCSSLVFSKFNQTKPGSRMMMHLG